MATFKCEECHTVFYWRPGSRNLPICPNCGNDNFKLEPGRQEALSTITSHNTEKDILLRIESLLERILDCVSTKDL